MSHGRNLRGKSLLSPPQGPEVALLAGAAQRPDSASGALSQLTSRQPGDPGIGRVLGCEQGRSLEENWAPRVGSAQLLESARLPGKGPGRAGGLRLPFQLQE